MHHKFNEINATNELTLEEIREEQDKELNKNSHNKCISGLYYLQTFFDNILNCFSLLYKAIKFIIKLSGIYLLWIFLHFIASHLYTTFCVPNSLYGLMMSPFMTPTPHCQGLRWVVYNGANVINNMWVILGTWICSNILILNKDNTH